jgi:DNA-directed RNA polymerase
MEYKRYVNFYQNENTFEFHTYLPIQMDATCNGFQHLALLSNENILFKELNLVVDGKEDRPNDFYSFLVHKLSKKFDKQIEEGNIIEKDGSYERLRDFVLERSYVKKAIMTIPYNVSSLNMRKYIISNLHLAEDKSKDNIH